MNEKERQEFNATISKQELEKYRKTFADMAKMEIVRGDVVELRGDDHIIERVSWGTPISTSHISISSSAPYMTGVSVVEELAQEPAAFAGVQPSWILLWESGKTFGETGNIWQIQHFLRSDGCVEVLQFLNGELKTRKVGNLWPATWRGGWRTLAYAGDVGLPEESSYIPTDVEEIEVLLEVLASYTSTEEAKTEAGLVSIIELQHELVMLLTEHLGWRIKKQEGSET